MRTKREYIPHLLANRISIKSFKLKLFYNYLKRFCFLEKHFILGLL